MSLEALEDRAVPATFPVLNGLDDGATFLLPFSLSDLQEQTSTFPLARSGVAG